MNTINLAFFEDNHSYRNSMSVFIIGDERFNLIGDFSNCLEIKQKLAALNKAPHVVLMDIDMPQKSGIEGVRELKQILPDCQILMLTTFEDEKNIFDAICAGASGYLLKRSQPEDILQACIDVLQGGAPINPIIAKKVLNAFQSIQTSSKAITETLTAKEKEILTCLVNGNSYKMTASKMDISIDTVRSHIKKVYSKLHVNSMNEAVAKAIKHGLV